MKRETLRKIGSIYRATNSFTDYLVNHLSLEKGQYQYLVRINENPNINQETISNLLQVDKATTAKAIKKLIEKGYATKVKSSEDKRNYQLSLTLKGKEICDFLKKEEQYCTKMALKNFSNQEQEELLLLLSKMHDNIFNIWRDIRKNNKEYYLNEIQNEY